MKKTSYNPGNYLKTGDPNFIPILKDALAGDESALQRPEIKALNINNLKLAIEWLAKQDDGVSQDIKTALAAEGWRLAYYRKPPTPEEFLTYDWIGPQSESIWPNVRKAFLEYMDPNPSNPARGLALSVSIGWGKSLLANLCSSYQIVLFGLMRQPYRLLGHSQPLYEKIKLPNGTYTTIADLKLGMEIAGVTTDTSRVLEIIPQGEKDTYELEFDDGLKCRCSLDHYWTVWDESTSEYKILPTKEIVKNFNRYGFPDEKDCKKDAAKIIKAEQSFTLY